MFCVLLARNILNRIGWQTHYFAPIQDLIPFSHTEISQEAL